MNLLTPCRFFRVFAAALLSTAILQGCAGYVPGRNAYWDAIVKENCLKDGGVTIYERVQITPRKQRELGGVGDTIPVPSRRSAKPGMPYVAEDHTTWLHRSNPEVTRWETLVVRTSDGKVLSRLVDYARVGEDFIRPYSCRDAGIRLDVERQTFEIRESKDDK
jgi:hypothetical protein